MYVIRSIGVLAVLSWIDGVLTVLNEDSALSRACLYLFPVVERVHTRISSMASSSSNVVGVHYRVGKKIGEGSFGVIFEGTNLLNNQQVAIKFVCDLSAAP